MTADSIVGTSLPNRSRTGQRGKPRLTFEERQWIRLAETPEAAFESCIAELHSKNIPCDSALILLMHEWAMAGRALRHP